MAGYIAGIVERTDMVPRSRAIERWASDEADRFGGRLVEQDQQRFRYLAPNGRPKMPETISEPFIPKNKEEQKLKETVDRVLGRREGDNGVGDHPGDNGK